MNEDRIPEAQPALDALVAEHFSGDTKPNRANCKNLTVTPRHDPTARAELLTHAKRYADKAEPADNGTRNSAALRLAGHLFAFTHQQTGETPAEHEVVELVNQWNQRNPEPLPEREIASTVHSAMTNGTPREPKIVGHDLRGGNLCQRIDRSSSVRIGQIDDGQAEPANVPVSFADLLKDHPTLHEPVVDGLVRRGETVNVIAAPKTGKSWLVYDLLLAIVTGNWWLSTYQCKAGRVLLIDNELHQPTIANRIPKVAQARNIAATEYADKLDILALRGQGVTLDRLQSYIDKIEAGYYSAVVVDAWYRAIPAGLNENSNSDIMALYNLLDRYAGHTKAAWFVIHHSSKGSQSDKGVTDVGAGAGAQSRAADAHLVLRPHEEPGHIVLEAAVRSFAPVEPIGLRWEFPVWQRAYELDTEALKGRKTQSEERQDQRDSEGMEAILSALSDGPRSTRQIRASAGGMGKDRAERLLDLLETSGRVRWEPTEIRGGKGRLYYPVNPVCDPVQTTVPGGPMT